MDCLSCKTRKGIRRVALVFALLTVLLLAADVTFMVVGAIYCEAKRRSYVWLYHGYGCLLRAANLCFIVAWIVAAAQDSAHRMLFSSMAMVTRIVGETLGAGVDFVWDALEGTDSIVYLIQMASLHYEEIVGQYWSYFTYLTVAIEVVFVLLLVHYQSGFVQALSGGSATSPAQPPQPGAASSPEREPSVASSHSSPRGRIETTRQAHAEAALPAHYPVEV